VGNQTSVKLSYAAKPEATTVSASPGMPAKLGLRPQEAKVAVNGVIRLDVLIEDTAGLFSVPLAVTYDPAVLHLADVAVGGLLAGDGMVPALARNIQNDRGAATVSISRGFGSPGVKGGGVVVTLVFQAAGPGTSEVTVATDNMLDPAGKPLGAGSAKAAVVVQ
jgi:hypothetical protein